MRIVYGDVEAAARAVFVAPVVEAGPHGIADVTLRRTRGGHRIDRLALAAHERQVPQKMLAVLGAHPHGGFAVFRCERALPEVADVGEQVAPLCGQQVDVVQPFGLAFEHGRRWRKKMHVHVGRHPTFRAQIELAPPR